MRVELLFFAGCPHVEAARQQLRDALAEAGLPGEWTEHDVRSPSTPPGLRVFGSPTVLVDGRDVVPGSVADADTCRLYPGSDRAGAPPRSALLSALRAARAQP